MNSCSKSHGFPRGLPTGDSFSRLRSFPHNGHRRSHKGIFSDQPDMDTEQERTASPAQPEAPPEPRWRRFCLEVMVPTEDQVMAQIGEFRGQLDQASGDEPIQTWHFAYTHDSRNYLVYTMLDTVFGFARHGEKVVEVVENRKFQELLHFLMHEEHQCFIKAVDKGDYFSSLANRMLRLSPLADQQQSSKIEQDPADPIDDVIPADPVDALFQFYGSADEPAPSQPSAEKTLNELKQRMERAREDDASNDKPILTAIQVRKECQETLRRFEKRLEKVAVAVKAMTQQMLQDPLEGECRVVKLFDRDLFFVAPTCSRDEVDKFLRLQKSLAESLGCQDRADAEACFQCCDFVPLVKEATCMPESLLSHIEESCKCHRQPDQQADADPGHGDGDEILPQRSEATPSSARDDPGEAEQKSIPNGDLVAAAEITPEPTQSEQRTEPGPPKPGQSEPADINANPNETSPIQAKGSPGQADKSPREVEKSSQTVEKSPQKMAGRSPKKGTTKACVVDAGSGQANPPGGTPVSSAEAAPLDSGSAQGQSEPGWSTPDQPADRYTSRFDKYFKDVDRPESATLRRCIFSIKHPKLSDYLCPVLGYLPLLPVIEQLITKMDQNEV